MSLIFLTDNLAKTNLPTGDSALWLYHDKSAAPAASRTITLSCFLNDPFGSVKTTELLVVCGLVSRITTPANRVKLGQFLTEPWSGPPRVSVDDKLFITDPWRMWWHFGCVGSKYGAWTTSYGVASAWNNYLIGRRGDDPCSIEMLTRFGTGIISARDAFYFASINIQTVAMSTGQHKRYQQEKQSAFAEEKTIAAIIARLQSFATLEYPFRNVPSYRELFDSPTVDITATDFGVDMFLLDGVRTRIDLINHAAKVFA